MSKNNRIYQTNASSSKNIKYVQELKKRLYTTEIIALYTYIYNREENNFIQQCTQVKYTRNTARALYEYNGKYAFRNNKPLLVENPYDVSYEDISAP